MRIIMKATTYGAFGIAAALLIAACVMFEDRIARVTTPDLATAVVDASCTGGQAFLERAVVGLGPTAASVLTEGVRTACALRAERTTISATVYDDPVTGFCAETPALAETDAAAATRRAFNARRVEICEVRP